MIYDLKIKHFEGSRSILTIDLIGKELNELFFALPELNRLDNFESRLELFCLGIAIKYGYDFELKDDVLMFKERGI